jgi:hypothetical protein
MYARVLWLLALAAAPGWGQVGAPVLTRERVIQIASDFCQRMDAPVGGDVTVEFPSDFPLGWQPRWRVRCQGTVVEVIDLTGEVCGYSDSRPDERLRYQTEGDAIAEDDAIRIATAALLKTGPHPELVFSGASLYQFASPAMASSHTYMVYWDRQFAGIPFKGPADGARVSLNAETGEVTGLSVVARTPPPASAAVAVTADRAALVAFGRIADENIGIGSQWTVAPKELTALLAKLGEAK